jgi:hypothetical protein
MRKVRDYDADEGAGRQGPRAEGEKVNSSASWSPPPGPMRSI